MKNSEMIKIHSSNNILRKIERVNSILPNVGSSNEIKFVQRNKKYDISKKQRIDNINKMISNPLVCNLLQNLNFSTRTFSSRNDAFSTRNNFLLTNPNYKNLYLNNIIRGCNTLVRRSIDAEK